MSNFIYSRVIIEPQEAMDKILTIVKELPSVPFGQETKRAVESFYDSDDLKRNIDETEYSDNNYDNPIINDTVHHSWLKSHVGTSWINIYFNEDDNNIGIDSPSVIPTGFLIKIYSILIKEFDDVKIYCRWWDETETQCGVALIKDGIYTEDECFFDSEYIHDTSYSPSGFEDINQVINWIGFRLDDTKPFTFEELNHMLEDDVRDIFYDWKIEEKWSTFTNNWNMMISECEKAIDEKDFDPPLTKIKKIAHKKYHMIQDCYPF
jgi:hypothetical protein